MDDEKLNSHIDTIIDDLEKTKSDETPFLRIIQMGGGLDECGLEGNSSGLKSMACILLRLSCDAGSDSIELNRSTANLMHETSDVHFHFLNRVDWEESPQESYVRNWKDRIFEWAFLTILFSVPIFWLIGFYAAVRWLFS